MARPGIHDQTDFKKPWREGEAPCQRLIREEGYNPGAWTEEGDDHAASARYYCKTQCDLRLACLEDAVSDPGSYGIRGGYFFEMGTLRRDEKTELYAELKIKAKPYRFRQGDVE